MRERSQGGLLSGKRESAKWLAMSCPECVHIELTQSSLLASGTLPVWNKRRERKLWTNKTDFPPPPFFLSLPKTLNSGNERSFCSLLFLVWWAIFFLMTRSIWFCQMPGMAGQHLADQPEDRSERLFQVLPTRWWACCHCNALEQADHPYKWAEMVLQSNRVVLLFSI